MAEFGLVMPFVVCKSEGGPYDDDSFVAGYECGLIDTDLDPVEHRAERRWTVHVGSLPQLDLIAMRNGYTMHTNGPVTEGDEWAEAVFMPADKDSEDRS